MHREPIQPRTCVFFHAHPDDEALFTAGTMARLASEGHRIVLVVATSGDQGLAAAEFTQGKTLSDTRRSELHASAKALGCARVEILGYADSGLHGDAEQVEGGPLPFVAEDVEVAAAKLAEILRAERADLVTIYDPAGGYGHPDHVQVHRVGSRAAELAGTPMVLEATADRGLILRLLRLVSKVYRFPPEFDIHSYETAFAASEEITHRVKVRRFAKAKRASMAAHVTQTTGGDSMRTLAALLKMPRPLFSRVLGTEWFVRRDVPPGTRLEHPLQQFPISAPEPRR